MTPASLPDMWRSRAEQLRRYAPAAAQAFDDAAADLERVVAEYADEMLPATVAAAESGYSTASLRRMVRDGVLPDHDGRYRRGDLPRKPGYGTAPEDSPVVAEAAPAMPPKKTAREVARAIARGEL